MKKDNIIDIKDLYKAKNKNLITNALNAMDINDLKAAAKYLKELIDSAYLDVYDQDTIFDLLTRLWDLRTTH